MAKKSELKAVLSMDDSRFVRGIKNAGNLAKRFAAQLARAPLKTLGTAAIVGTEKALSLATKAAAILGAVGGVALVGFGAKAIQAAADAEQFRVTLDVLLGSAEKGADRMKMLTKFSNTTPFQLEGVVKADIVLQSLTHGLLATEKGLRLVGDVAAGLNKPFDELSNTIGELFAGIRSGSAVGGPLERLQVIGAMTAGGRRKIEGLNAGGFNIEAWKVAEAELMRFSGMMVKQSATWNGLWSTFQDSMTNAFRTIGTPLLKTLKPVLKDVTDKLFEMEPDFEAWGTSLGTALKTGLDTVKAFFQNPGDMLNKFGELLGDVVMKAIQSGLGRGMKAIQDKLSDDFANFINWGNMTKGGEFKDGKLVNKNTQITNRHVDVEQRVAAAGSGLRERGHFTGPLAQSWFAVGRPLKAFLQDRERGSKLNALQANASLAQIQGAKGGVGSGLSSWQSMSQRPAFGSALDGGGRRTTSLLRGRELRAMDRARRAEIAARIGGREVGDTKVRRGDRKRMLDLVRGRMREKEGLEKTNAILERMENKFDAAWGS